MEDVLGRATFHRVFDHMKSLAAVLEPQVLVCVCCVDVWMWAWVRVRRACVRVVRLCMLVAPHHVWVGMKEGGDRGLISAPVSLLHMCQLQPRPFN